KLVQLARGAILVLLADVDAEPALEQRVDHAAVDSANVGAVRRLRRLAAQQPLAVGEPEAVGGAVELAPDLPVALPDRVARLVPGELVGVDEVAGSRAGDDDPVREVVTAAQPQAARRVPVGAA